jgi:hypothetical protein
MQLKYENVERAPSRSVFVPTMKKQLKLTAARAPKVECPPCEISVCTFVQMWQRDASKSAIQVPCTRTFYGNRRSFSAPSYAGLFKFARSQASQNLKSDLRFPELRCEGHHGRPVRRWDASCLPAAHSRVRLLQLTSDRASSTQGHDD